MKNYIPILNWLPTYNKSQLKGDLIAGLTVGIMLIPQGMAYAMIAGLPPIYGLYASIAPLIIYAIFGTSRQLAVGPVAMVSLLVAAGVSVIAQGDLQTYINLAITLALMVGVIQFLLGVFQLGFLVNFLSHPVISGFTSAAALIIGLSQLKHLIGVDLERSHHVHEIVLNTIERASEIHWSTFAIGTGGIVLILLAKKYAKKIPGPLLAVVFGILITAGLGLDAQGVKIVKDIPTGLPSLVIPSIDWVNIQKLFPIALTISLVGFMESIAVAKAIQAKHRDYKVVPNQELIGLGLANIGGSFFQSYPTTGGFSRTAVNDQSGAKTGMASIISAVLIALTLLFLTPLFYYLPKAILASVIMVAVFGLIDIKEAKHLWHADRRDFWMLIVTFVSTLALGIEQGILIGVILSLMMVIYQTTKPHVALLGKLPNEPHYKNLDRFPHLINREEILIYRFDARLYFANTNHFKETIETAIINKGNALRLLIIDADSINSIDSSGVHAIEEIIALCKERNIELFLVGVKGPVRDVFHKTNLFEKIGEEHFFMRIQHAVDAYDNKQGQDFDKYLLENSFEKAEIK